MSPKICLVALVKDEEPVIRRCLEALKPHVDSWVIFDTGSTDDTMAVIQEVMADLPGELLERPFEGFAKSRSDVMAVASARDDADYLLMIDADDTWTPEENFEWPEQLDADVYEVKLVMGSNAWYRGQLTKASKPWRYEGAAHEYLVCAEPFRRGPNLAGVVIRCGRDGARRRKEPIKKYERVAEILEKELESNPHDARSMFYLAQSYRDARQPDKALAMYQRRADAKGFVEEVWYSLFQIGLLHERLGHDWELARAAYERAFAFRPSRAEPLVELARHYRTNGDHARGFLYACAAKEIPFPSGDRLYVDQSVYTWRALDEYAVSSYWSGHRNSSLMANLRLASSEHVPLRELNRIEENLTFSLPQAEPLGKRVSQGDRVTVVVPTYRCPSPDKLRRAVKSVLEQTYSNLLCVVVSDGDETPPWDALKDIEDPRLVRYHLPENRGQFFAMDVVLRATPDGMFAVQDDDDESVRSRLQQLVTPMVRKKADVVFCHVEKKSPRGSYVRYARPSWLLRYPVQALIHVAPHMGLFNTAALLRLGGYAGPVRLGYDTLVVDMAARLGRPAFVHKILYHQHVRHGSMTTTPETAPHSEAREAAFNELRRLWREIVRDEDSVEAAQRLTEVDADQQEERDRHVQHLAELIGRCPQGAPAKAPARRPSLSAPVAIGDRVTVTIATHGCEGEERRAALRRAVDSVLAQTYGHLRLVVVSDGDAEPAWDVISDIDDPRLVRFHLPENRGQFFAHEVVRRATPDSLFALQDDDDWSNVRRLELLCKALCEEDADVVFNRTKDQAGTIYRIHPNRVDHDALAYVGSHMGLFKTASLGAVGGYYAGFRMSYDMFLTFMLARLGRSAFVMKPLYERDVRAGSMTQREDVGMKTPTRMKLRGQLEAASRRILQSPAPLAELRAWVDQNSSSDENRELERHADELRILLRSVDQVDAAAS